MEKEDLGPRPVTFFGLGMTTPHRSCVISENGQSPPCLGIGSGSSDLKRRLLAARKQSVREQGFMNLSPGTLGVGAHIWPQDALWLPMDEEAWSKEVTAGSVGLHGVGAAVKVNKLLSWLQASPPNKHEKGGVLAVIFKIMEIFLSSWKHKAGKSLSSINIESFV